MGDVEFLLMAKQDLSNSFGRTSKDDKLDAQIKIPDISPLDQVKMISYDALNILLETFDKECSRIAKVADQLADCTDKVVMPALSPRQVIQSVKSIATFIGNIETLDITAACD